MTHRKQWTPQEKLNIVLQGLRGTVKISELCNEHGITQAMYYEWKNLLLSQGTRIFERGGIDHEQEHLEKENRKLKETIGELHMELKKKRLVARRRRVQSAFYLNLLPLVEKLKGGHPAWGIRRVTAYLKKYVDCKVNHKGIALLMRNNGLVVLRNTRLRARREPKTRKPFTDIPNTFWGEDMTRTWTRQGWACVHVVLDWGSKMLLALLASATSRASDWIRVLDTAVNLQYPVGLDPDEPYQFIPRIVSDNGCQPTSRTFGEHERRLGLEIVMRSLHQQNAFPIVL